MPAIQLFVIVMASSDGFQGFEVYDYAQEPNHVSHIFLALDSG